MKEAPVPPDVRITVIREDHRGMLILELPPSKAEILPPGVYWPPPGQDTAIDRLTKVQRHTLAVAAQLAVENNGVTSVNAIAERLGLSAWTILDRVSPMRRDGFFTGLMAELQIVDRTSTGFIVIPERR